MTSMFDTLVRNRRNQTPWARISVVAFMREMLWNAPGPGTWTPSGGAEDTNDTILRVRRDYRSPSREWWSIEWTSTDGKRATTGSQYLDLCMWRAAEHEMQARDKEDRRIPPPAEDVERSMEDAP